MKSFENKKDKCHPQTGMFCMFLNFWNQDTNVLEGKFLWPLLQIDPVLPYYDFKNQQIMEMLGLTISHANLL